MRRRSVTLTGEEEQEVEEGEPEKGERVKKRRITTGIVAKTRYNHQFKFPFYEIFL